MSAYPGAMHITKLTPILIVDSVEASLPFWLEGLGFEKQVEVPHEGRLGFVILVKDGVEVMMQTRASVAADCPGVAKRNPSCVLYSEVASLDEAVRAVKGAEVLVPVRDTPYGTKEIFVADPGGNILGFAEHA